MQYISTQLKFSQEFSLRTFRHILAHIGKTFVIWKGRITQRGDLRKLDPRLLRDIGVSRDQADQEAARPFWD